MIQEALIFGLVYSIWVGVLILLSFKHEPRMWLHHFPKEVREAVPEKTPEETRLMRMWGVVTTGSMLFLPLLVTLWRDAEYDFAYFDAVVFIATMMLVFCLYDLLVLDWLISVWWNPKWMQIQGAEDFMHHNSFGYQLKRNLLGLPFPLVGALVTAIPFLWL